MKKKIAGAIFIGILCAVQNLTFAASNPYADVDRTSKEYGAVENLIEQGLISGCDLNDFHNLKRLTRYDFAVYIAQALSRINEADEKTQAEIRELATKYAYELKVIGVIDENIPGLEGESEINASNNIEPEKKSETLEKFERFRIGGSGRIRYDGAYTNGNTMSHGTDTGFYSPNNHVNVDITYGYKINKNWELCGESEWGHNLNDQTHNQTLQNSLFSKMFLEGKYKVGDNDLKILAGRFGRYTPFGIGYDEKINGLALTYGKNLKATLEFGRVVAADEYSTPDGSPYEYRSPQYQGFNLEYEVPSDDDSRNTKIFLHYNRIGGNVYQHQLPNKHVNYIMAGVEQKFDNNVRAQIGVIHSDAKGYADTRFDVLSTKKTGWLAKVVYKEAKFDDVGSFDIFAFYRHSPQLASFSNADDWMRNTKGLRVGFDYVFMKNMSFTGYYTFGKDIDTGAKNDSWRTQWNFNI